MSIYQRKNNGLWISAWYEAGKKKTKAFKDEQTARAFEAERLSRLQTDYNRLTLSELVVLFFRSHPDYHEKTKGTIITLITGREEGQEHLPGAAEFMRDKYADALNRQDLERLREYFRSRGTGNNTINKYQAYIRAILAWGADQELIPRNPWRDYKRLPTKREIVTTTIADIRAIYEYAPEWLRWAMMTMYALSLRPGHIELFSLMWNAFNWQRGYVMVRQGKSGKIKTVFPPHQYLELAAQKYADDMMAGIPWVCHRQGRRVINYRKAWEKAVKDARLPHIPMYNIRHVAASEMLAQGADLAAVAAQLGHANVNTTGSTYAHVTPGGQQRAAALMPGLKNDDSE